MERETLKSGEDVDAILRIALRQEPGSADELRLRLTRSAEDLGISPEALAQAEKLYLADGDQRRQQQLAESKIDTFMKAKAAGFKAHFVSFFSTNLLLNVIWFLTGRDFYWPGIVLAAWGIGLSSHYLATKQRSTTKDRDFLRWLGMGEPNNFTKDDHEKELRERLKQMAEQADRF